jgi:hypothetical protein
MRDFVGSCMIGAALFTAVVRAGLARPAHVPRDATPVQTLELYTEDTEKEPGDRQDSARRFRGSPWSQDDDFHSKEMKRVKGFAKSHSVSVESLLDGLDEGMRQRWATPSENVPNPKVMPCRPRLIY